MTKYLDRCFTRKSNRWFLEYMEIITNRIHDPIRKGNNGTVESHHIVPRAWFRENGIKVDNSMENKVNLTISEHLDAHFSLARYFKSIGDKRMFTKMFFAVNLMMKAENGEMERIRNLSDEDYDKFERMRSRHVDERKKRTVYSLRDGKKKRIMFFEKTPRGYTSSFEKGRRARDRFRSVKLTYRGRTKTRREWARLLGINESVIRMRQKKGWSVAESLGFS